jgi:F0F1-type ATP synthase assembly protein I
MGGQVIAKPFPLVWPRCQSLDMRHGVTGESFRLINLLGRCSWLPRVQDSSHDGFMGRRRWRHRPPSSLLLGVLLLGLAVVCIVIALDPDVLPRASKIADLAGAAAPVTGVVALGSGLLELGSSLRRLARPAPASTTTDIDKAKDVLAGLVIEQWSKETVLRSLGDPEPIPVPWGATEHEELMDHPRLIARGDVCFANLRDQITVLANDFRDLRCRRLVILGGAGTGKTTLAVQLLMELVKTRLPGEPVPVLLSAGRWNSTTHPRLQDWLTACLDMDYPALRAEGLSPDAPSALVTRSEVLPVVDGLDELPAEARAGILGALNRSMSDCDQLILTCRTEQFAQSVDTLGDVLNAAAVIEPHPLSPDRAADYLEACLPPRPRHDWCQVLTALRKGAAPALAEVTSTPFGLWLVRAAYVTSRQDPSPLLDLGRGDASVLNDHLCDELIPAVVAARPPAEDPAQPFQPRHAWDPDHVRRWLSYLSRQLMLGGEDTHDMAWWHLARYTSTRPVRLVVSLVCGVMVGLAIGILTGSTVAGVAIGIVSAVAIMITSRAWFTEPPGYAEFQLRGRLSLLVKTLTAALIVGLLGALVGWLMGRSMGEDVGLMAARQTGLLSGLGFLVVLGLRRWVEHPATTSTARSPRSSWRADRNLALIRAFIGLVIGLMGAFLVQRAELGSANAAVGAGVLLGLLIGLMLGSHHAWLAYSLTVTRLATKGRLPLRAMNFLDDAHRLGLLRTEGPFYQFRNFELQRHLSRH